MELKNWEPEKIREELKKVGITQSGIARDLGRAPCTVHHVIQGAASDRIRQHIALCINRPVEEIWPESYLKNDAPAGVGRKLTRGLYDNEAA